MHSYRLQERAINSMRNITSETTLLSVLEAMLVHGMIVQGQADSKHYSAAAVGSPREKELESCKDLGKEVVFLLTKLKA